MDLFRKVIDISNDEKVTLGSSFKELLHKKLVLGQTRYVCRNGTLSDGHEKLTPALRYYQSIKEMYCLASNIRNMKADAMIAQADIIDAQEKESSAITESDKLRQKGLGLKAQERLLTCLVTVEDQMRMLDEYNKVRLELEPIVDKQYPEGIEQAEQDNWEAVFKFRAMVGGNLNHVPLEMHHKAKVSAQVRRQEGMAWLYLNNKSEAESLLDYEVNNVQKILP